MVPPQQIVRLHCLIRQCTLDLQELLLKDRQIICTSRFAKAIIEVCSRHFIPEVFCPGGALGHEARGPFSISVLM